jgi:glycosyltransferase involved in cell wall biosynthesis
MRARRITLLAAGDERRASTRYRLLAYRPALRAAGFDSVVRFPRDRSARGPSRPAWRAVDLLQDLLDPALDDLLFIQRKTYPPALAPLLRRRRRPVVYDMDDALDLPPPSLAPGRSALRRYRRNFEATAAAADLVICGNRELAARLPHERHELLATPVDTDRFSPAAVGPPSGKVLGWVGHADNLDYLASLAEPLREVARRHPGLRLVVVADRPLELPGLEVEFRPWSLEREVACFEGMAVGLMPLADTPWARGKCAFKAIQYMALGIPAVLSPVGMNREVIEDGANGFLAGSPERWVEALDRLLSDSDLAMRVGKEGRRTAVHEYSLDVASKRLVGILRDVIQRRQLPYNRRGAEDRAR